MNVFIISFRWSTSGSVVRSESKVESPLWSEEYGFFGFDGRWDHLRPVDGFGRWHWWICVGITLYKLTTVSGQDQWQTIILRCESNQVSHRNKISIFLRIYHERMESSAPDLVADRVFNEGSSWSLPDDGELMFCRRMIVTLTFLMKWIQIYMFIYIELSILIRSNK